MSGTMHPLVELCRVYRDAHARYASAFARGDVNAIEDAFSRMQDLSRAFHDGARWAENTNKAQRKKNRK